MTSKPNATTRDLAKSLHRATNVAAGITAVLAFVFGYIFFNGTDAVVNWWGFPVALVAGLFVGMGIGFISEYYTSDHYRPVKKIAEQSNTGAATTVLGRISSGLQSVAPAVVLIVVAVGIAYWAANAAVPGGDITGIYGIALAAIGMLATTGVVVSVDAYGPIADNAGGIAEMAHLPPEVRAVTDSLDSLGNTTAAIAKGFAVGSAAITALALFKAFEQAVFDAGGTISLDIGDKDLLAGMRDRGLDTPPARSFIRQTCRLERHGVAWWRADITELPWHRPSPRRQGHSSGTLPEALDDARTIGAAFEGARLRPPENGTHPRRIIAAPSTSTSTPDRRCGVRIGAGWDDHRVLRSGGARFLRGRESSFR